LNFPDEIKISLLLFFFSEQLPSASVCEQDAPRARRKRGRLFHLGRAYRLCRRNCRRHLGQAGRQCRARRSLLRACGVAAPSFPPEWMMHAQRPSWRSCSRTNRWIRQFAGQPIARAVGPLPMKTRRLAPPTKLPPSGLAISDNGPRPSRGPRRRDRFTGAWVAGCLGCYRFLLLLLWAGAAGR
jgi:hypothetical protein